jgi:hypothetical protein
MALENEASAADWLNRVCNLATSEFSPRTVWLLLRKNVGLQPVIPCDSLVVHHLQRDLHAQRHRRNNSYWLENKPRLSSGDRTTCARIRRQNHVELVCDAL